MASYSAAPIGGERMLQRSALEGAKILIVEDETEISHLLQTAIIEAGGHIVGPAAEITEALHLIDTIHIDAAIVDLIVQGTYCDEVAERLSSRGIAFAVTTGIGADKFHPALLAAPAITKPFQGEYVGEVLRKLVRQRR